MRECNCSLRKFEALEGPCRIPLQNYHEFGYVDTSNICFPSSKRCNESNAIIGTSVSTFRVTMFDGD